MWCGGAAPDRSGSGIRSLGSDAAVQKRWSSSLNLDRHLRDFNVLLLRCRPMLPGALHGRAGPQERATGQMSRSKGRTTFVICSDQRTERTTRATDPDHGITYQCGRTARVPHRTTNRDKSILGGRILGLDVLSAILNASVEQPASSIRHHSTMGACTHQWTGRGAGPCTTDVAPAALSQTPLTGRPAYSRGWVVVLGRVKTAGSILISLDLN